MLLYYHLDRPFSARPSAPINNVISSKCTFCLHHGEHSYGAFLLLLLLLLSILPKGRHTQKAEPVQGASPIINYIKYKQDKNITIHKEKH